MIEFITGTLFRKLQEEIIVNVYDGYNVISSNSLTILIGQPEVAVNEEFEIQSSWIAGVNGDDASAGIWERAIPNPTYDDNGQIIQPDFDHTENGQYCFVTGNAVSQNDSEFGFDDVDGGKTTLVSPEFDLSNYSHLNYYELEEALANSFCLKKSGSIFKTILKNFMDHQPNGYRDYNSVKWQKQLRVGCSVLGACASDDPRNNSLNNQNQPISPYESFYHVDLKHVKIDDVPVYLVHNVPIENRINLFVPKPPNEWLRHENFRKEFRKLAKSYGGRLLKWFDKSIELAASPDKSEQNKVVNKKIQGNDHLWEFRLNEGIRAFYKVCNNDRILLVGIKKHPPLSGAGYQKLYRKNPDYCEETTKISK